LVVVAAPAPPSGPSLEPLPEENATPAPSPETDDDDEQDDEENDD